MVPSAQSLMVYGALSSEFNGLRCPQNAGDIATPSAASSISNIGSLMTTSGDISQFVGEDVVEEGDEKRCVLMWWRRAMRRGVY